MYNENDTNVGLPKWVVVCISIGIAAIASIALISSCVHRNEIQEFQVIQSISGDVTIKSDGGYYFAFMPKIWTYPKVQTVYFSNEKDESTDNDGVKVRFENKGEGDISSQVVYRLYNSNDEITTMHQYVAGNQGRVEDLILAKLKDTIMDKASNITSSQAIEDYEGLANAIREDFVKNPELKQKGILIESFSITRITFDTTTTDLFTAQQRADLAKKTAEAEKQNLIMQKERTEAEYARQIAEAKGKAETEKMKQVTDAERQKELAEIAAKQKVEVEKLAKEEALIKASKLLELAEIDKKTEATKLEMIKIQAEQKIASAQAKKQEIELSGAMSETVKYKLDIDKETKIGVAKAWAEGIRGLTLPKTIMLGGDGGTTNPIDMFFNLKNVKMAEEVSK